MRKRSPSNGFTESPYLEEALQVAYYHCVLEMPLKAIADLMGKSPATIPAAGRSESAADSRLCAFARHYYSHSGISRPTPS